MTLSDNQKNFALTFVSTLLSLLLLGGAYEWLKGREYEAWKHAKSVLQENMVVTGSDNPALIWEYSPNRKAKELHTNRYGFRDEDYPTIGKPDGVYRVTFIGDSVTLGLGVAYPDIFVRRFQDLAQQAGRTDLQALNFGIGGYNTLQIQELLSASVLTFEPDHVVYVMCLNDFDFDDSSGELRLYFQRPQSFLMQAIADAGRRLSGKHDYIYDFEKNGDRVFRAIQAIEQTLRERAISFTLVVLPFFPRSIESFADYPYGILHDGIHRAAMDRGVEIIDLLPEFIAAGRAPRHWAIHNDEWHPNALGHDRIAHALANALLEPNPR